MKRTSETAFKLIPPYGNGLLPKSSFSESLSYDGVSKSPLAIGEPRPTEPTGGGTETLPSVKRSFLRIWSPLPGRGFWGYLLIFWRVKRFPSKVVQPMEFKKVAKYP